MEAAMPMTTPANARKNPLKVTVFRMVAREAPRAMRMPSSGVRSLTARAITAAIPVQEISSARAAIKPSRVVMSREDAIDASRRTSMVSKLSTASSGSTFRMVSRSVGMIASGSAFVRTIMF